MQMKTKQTILFLQQCICIELALFKVFTSHQMIKL
jgi:hypothetical protein